MENVESLGKDLPCESLPRKQRKANVFRRQAILSSAECYGEISPGHAPASPQRGNRRAERSPGEFSAHKTTFLLFLQAEKVNPTLQKFFCAPREKKRERKRKMLAREEKQGILLFSARHISCSFAMWAGRRLWRPWKQPVVQKE
jgi:hypothetical protein